MGTNDSEEYFASRHFYPQRDVECSCWPVQYHSIHYETFKTLNRIVRCISNMRHYNWLCMKLKNLMFINVRALRNISYRKTNTCTNVDIIFLRTIHQNCQHVSIYLDHLQGVNINNACIKYGLLNTFRCLISTPTNAHT
jgi:hypothetical protein